MKAAIISLVVFASASGPVRAGINEWTDLGPDGGHVAVLAIDPQNPKTLFAATLGGLFRTTDGGANWQPANAGLPVAAVPLRQNVVTSLAVDPRHSGTVYAGIRGQTIFLCAGACNIPVPGGIFKSTDAGASWKPVNSGLESVWFFGSLAIDPRNPDTVYAVTYHYFNDTPRCPQGQPCFYSTVVKSTDGAASWVPAGAGLPPTDKLILSLAIDPQGSGTLYAGTEAGIFKTTDGGASWSAVFSSATRFPFLYVDPGNPRTLYAWNGKELFKATDGGATWSSTGPVPQGFISLAIDTQNAGALYASAANGLIFKSTDEGANWQAVVSRLPALQFFLLADSQTPGTLYAATNDGRGIFKTTDGAGSWSAANAGLRQTSVSALAVDRKNPGTFYAATDIGLFKTTDGAKSWTEANSGLPQTGGAITSIAIDPQDPGIVYALNNGQLRPGPLSSAQPGGIFKSTDGGASWTAANSGFAGIVDWLNGSLLIDSRDPSVIHVAAIEYGFTHSIFESTDGADAWTQVGLGHDLRTIDPQNASTFYGVNGYGGLSKSTDSGANWRDLVLPPDSSTEDDDDFWTPVISVTVDPQNSSTVYVTGSGGIFKSADGGESWISLNPGLHAFICQNGCYEPYYVRLLAIDPQHSQNLYAISRTCEPVTCGDGVLRSTDGGMSWNIANTGLPPPGARTIGSLAIDPNRPGTVYAGTSDGVYEITFVP